MTNHCEQDARAAELARNFGALLDQLVNYYTDKGAGLAPDLLAASLTRHLMRQAVATAAAGYAGIGRPFDVQKFAALTLGFIEMRQTFSPADPETQALDAIVDAQEVFERVAALHPVAANMALSEHAAVIVDELAGFYQAAGLAFMPEGEQAHA